MKEISKWFFFGSFTAFTISGVVHADMYVLVGWLGIMVFAGIESLRND